MFLDNIYPNKDNGLVRVGLIIENNNTEIMLVKDEIVRINKQVYNIPFVDIKSFNQMELTEKIEKKYGFKIADIKGYINEDNFLDEECNEKLQINMCCRIDGEITNNFKWTTAENILNKVDVPSNVKQCIAIYKYNTSMN